ncbi:hypothetical protein TrST_g5936, partial [Triparma strigata]
AKVAWHPDAPSCRNEHPGPCKNFKTLDENERYFALDMRGNGGGIAKCAPDNVMIGCLSCAKKELRDGIDIAVPPPTFLHEEYPDSVTEVEDRCLTAERLAYFRGQGRTKIRKQVAQAVLNETDIVVDLTKGYNNQELNAFQELANSKFGLIIRGDNMFTYRFSEVCAMGVVP